MRATRVALFFPAVLMIAYGIGAVGASFQDCWLPMYQMGCASCTNTLCAPCSNGTCSGTLRSCRQNTIPSPAPVGQYAQDLRFVKCYMYCNCRTVSGGPCDPNNPCGANGSCNVSAEQFVDQPLSGDCPSKPGE
jgi:hypothetical protein